MAITVSGLGSNKTVSNFQVLLRSTPERLPGMLCLLAASHAPDHEELKSVKKKQKTEIIIDIYGPLGLARFVRTAMSLSRSLLSIKFRVNELVPTQRKVFRLV